MSSVTKIKGIAALWAKASQGIKRNNTNESNQAHESCSLQQKTAFPDVLVLDKLLKWGFWVEITVKPFIWSAFNMSSVTDAFFSLIVEPLFSGQLTAFVASSSAEGRELRPQTQKKCHVS